MNFFEHQDQARKQTGILVLFFILAVILIVLIINVTVVAIYAFLNTDLVGQSFTDLFGKVDPDIYYVATLATLGVISAGTLYRVIQLSQGGRAVAEMVGARLVDRNTDVREEQMLLNIVDEMSIASGTMAPAVYIMNHERGINAFAAGYTPNSAIITVTSGTLTLLNRDELQGVIAHEFSHILNGDMRLNIRLLGVLNGILLIGSIGLYILRGLTRTGGRRRGDGRGEAAALFIGLALAIVGYTGVFFGRLIKSAVSRQREFLADASAVQFTRNPEGITHALNKIRAHLLGSLVSNSHAEELSHMFFGEGFKIHFLSGLLATHPPLEDRITRIMPGFDLSAPLPEIEYPMKQTGPEGEQTGPFGDSVAQEEIVNVDAQSAVASIGNPGAQHMAFAAMLYGVLSSRLLDKLRNVGSARAVVYGLLLSDDKNVRERQVNQLAVNEESQVVKQSWNLYEEISSLGPRYRLPLLDLALPVLKEMDRDQVKRFLDSLETLLSADNKLSLKEFVFLTIIRKRLSASAERADRVRYRRLAPVLSDCRFVLSLLSHSGSTNSDEAEEAFSAGAKELGYADMNLADIGSCKLSELQQVLLRLAGLTPILREKVIHACAAVVLHDNRAIVPEAELLRAVCESLDSPMPPLLSS